MDSGWPINGSSTLPHMARKPAPQTEFAQRLLTARTHAGFTQPQLAKMAGMAQSTYAGLEVRGQGSSYTAQIAAACGVRAEWLASGDGLMVDTSALLPEVAQVAQDIQALPYDKRREVLSLCRELIKLSRPGGEAEAEPEVIAKQA